MLMLIAALVLSTQAVEEQLFPEIIKVIPPTISLTATTTDTADGCAFVPVSRNTRDFRVLACRGNNSRLADGSTGNLNLTGGLQISQLQDFYAWNNQRTPENPFVLYNFNTPVIITRIVITFALLQNYTISSKIPIITMFVSDTNSNYPSRSIPVNYNDNNVPNTGVYHLELVPSVGEPYRYWCVDMEPPNGTNWVIVSEVTLYQQLTQTGITVTPIMIPSTTRDITSVISRFVTTTSMAISTTTDISSVTSRSMAAITTSQIISAPSSSDMTATVTSSVSPSTMPNVSSTGETFSQNLFKFLHPQENPVIYYIMANVTESVKLNCTAFYNGSADDIIVTWTSNEKLIYTEQESLTENYKITTVLTVVGKSQAMFMCTFRHSSGWSDSREFIFKANDLHSSNESKFPMVIVLAAAGGVLLLVFAIAIICLVLYCRCKSAKKNKMKDKMKHIKTSESNVYLQHNSLYNVSNSMLEDACYDEPTYNVNNTKSPTVGLSPIPENIYYDKILYNIDDNSGKFLDIYDLSETNRISNRVSCSATGDNSYEDIYLESIHPQELMTASERIYNNEEDKNSTLLPYTSMYDNPAPLTKIEAPVTVSWDNIILCKKLGNGQFGEVILALTVNLSLKDLKLSSKDDDKSNQTLVAIKTLKDNDNDEVQKAFEKEIKFMSRLDHGNVIKTLGICPTGVPFLMMEYMENGDLNSFLKKHKYSEDLLHSDEVDLPILMYIAMQVVYGMNYLASRKFVHRDLAARNCLVGRNFVVKVADFGMGQNLYSSHYFILQGAAILPIRWMATESFYGKFSVKTDVWSYGVTMWEIFTLCKVTPYNELNDQQLIIDIMLGPKRKVLPKPDICPDEVYKLMLRCFVHDSSQRANFSELYDKFYEVYSRMQ